MSTKLSSLVIVKVEFQAPFRSTLRTSGTCFYSRPRAASPPVSSQNSWIDMSVHMSCLLACERERACVCVWHRERENVRVCGRVSERVNEGEVEIAKQYLKLRIRALEPSTKCKIWSFACYGCCPSVTDQLKTNRVELQSLICSMSWLCQRLTICAIDWMMTSSATIPIFSSKKSNLLVAFQR